MPAERRQKCVVDERTFLPSAPESAVPSGAYGAESLATPAEASALGKSARRGKGVVVSGVVNIDSPQHSATAGSIGAEGVMQRFSIPAAVLQRMFSPLSASAPSAEVAGDVVAMVMDEPSASPLSPGDNGTASSGAEEMDGTAAIAEHLDRAAAAAAGGSTRARRPLIMSRRWNRYGGAHGNPTSPPAKADVEEADAVGLLDGADGDGMIKFGKPSGAFGDHTYCSSSSSDSESASGSASEAVEATGSKEERAMLQRKQRRERHHRARVDRHMAGFDDTFIAEQEAELLAEDVEEEEEEDTEEGSAFEEEGRCSDGIDEGTEGSQRGGFGIFSRARAEPSKGRDPHMTAASADDVKAAGSESADDFPEDIASSSHLHARRQRFGSMLYESHVNRQDSYPCHHTLLCLNGPVTVHGPCGVMGFGIGEMTLGGFYLGKKQVTLWSPEQRAVLMPMKKLKSKNAQLSELPHRDLGKALSYASAEVGSVLNPAVFREQMNQRRRGAASASGAPDRAGEEEEDDDNSDIAVDALQDVEAVFGSIDWGWVQKAVTDWKALFSNKLLPMALVLQPFDPARGDTATRKHYLRVNLKQRRQGQGKDVGGWSATASAEAQAKGATVHHDAYIDVPRFLARRGEQNIDLALVQGVVPAVARMGCGSVLVVGSQGIGKSTLCRFLTNALLSQHGVCYWLDLDLGQPEFGVPGQISLYCVRHPLLRPHDTRCAELVQAYFLGATTASCPVTTAKAIASICALTARVQNDHPVVVNTHGWVLHTGRRVTSEVVRRLRPQQVVHLVKGGEEAWARDTAALMDTANGLNGDVLARRYLVRCGAQTAERASSSTKMTTGATAKGPRKRGRSGAVQPHGPGTGGGTGASPPPSAEPPTPVLGLLPLPQLSSSAWTGAVHTVRVKRETGRAAAGGMLRKGTAARQQRWREALMPLLHFHESKRPTWAEGVAGSTLPLPSSSASNGASATTLLRAPLHTLRSVVLAGMAEDQGGSVTRAELAAALEHAVVGVRFHIQPSPPTPHPRLHSRAGEGLPGGVPVLPLSSVPGGFAVSCYGFVESTEAQLCEGEIALRLPIRPGVVREMLRHSPSTGISIAYSATLRQDTSFMEGLL